MKKLLIIAILVSVLSIGAGCTDQASRVSHNLSKEADSFNVIRQITVMSLITNDVLFQMTGKMSIWPLSDRLEVIVESDYNIYKKHFIHLGDNMTYIVEDLGIGANNVSNHKYSLRYNPKMWIPVEIKEID
jgi:hypothetical protein